MKFYIYSLFFTLTIGINICLGNRVGSEIQVASQSELTFSASNSIPQSATVMESIFAAKHVAVRVKMVKDVPENSLVFSVGDLNATQPNLRFKQSDEGEGLTKNFEAPEIRLAENTKKTQKFEPNFLQVDYNSKRLNSVENNLLSNFKNTLDKYIFPKQTEVVSVTTVDNISMKK